MFYRISPASGLFCRFAAVPCIAASCCIELHIDFCCWMHVVATWWFVVVWCGLDLCSLLDLHHVAKPERMGKITLKSLETSHLALLLTFLWLRASYLLSFQELACQYSSKSSLCFGKWSSAFLPVSDERKSMKQSTKFDLGVCHSENNFNKITTYFCIVFVLLP